MAIDNSRESESAGPLFGERAERVLRALSLAAAFGLIALVAVRWNAYQWDFHMFYGAAVEFAAGQSPYRGQGLSYYHPPLMLYIYWPFTLLPVSVAIGVWYALKLLALAALFTIWHRDFERLQIRTPTILFFIVAYGAAIYGDLVSGNVSIFEQLLIWFGFSRFLRGRYVVFAACIVFAAQVKLTPIFFAVLLIAACEPRQWRTFFATIFAFIAVFSLNYWLQPLLFANFWTVMPMLDERGVQCTTFLALLRDISDMVLGAEFTKRSLIDEGAFLGIAGSIVMASFMAWREYVRRGTEIDRRLLICFSCFVLVLISPRMKGYSYILLLIPTLYLFRNVNWRRYVPLAVACFAVLVLFPQGQSALPIRVAFVLFNNYLQLFATLAIWAAYVGVLLGRIDLPKRQIINS